MSLLEDRAAADDKPEIVGDSAYGEAATWADLEEPGFAVTAKCPPARNTARRYSKDQVTVDLQHSLVTCAPGNTTTIIVAVRGGRASFRPWCGTCPLRAACTASARGAAPSPSPPRSSAPASPRRPA
jgi:hypothetical protein